MAKEWYVIHTYSGYENKAKDSLAERVKAMGKESEFGEIIVPTENVVELVNGKKKTTTRKCFPGYMIVQMDLTEENWHLVRNTPKITGFVGGATNPPSISEEEVKAITNQMTEGILKPKPKVSFDKGELVRIIDGPFTNFTGVVEDVKPEKGKLSVSVSIFGRPTPVELEFIQVEKG